MRVAPATVGALGFDCVQTIATAAQASALVSAGFRFAVRYLGGLSTTEVATILNSGL